MFSLMIQRPKTPPDCAIQPRVSVIDTPGHSSASFFPPGLTPRLKFANGKPLPEIVHFDVHLDRPRQTFFSGDVVSGEVRIHLADYLTVKAIIVRFVGEAYVNVPGEDECESPWDIRRIARIKHAFRKNRVRPSGTSGGGLTGDATPVKASFASPNSEVAPETNGCSLQPVPISPLPNSKQPSSRRRKPGGKPPPDTSSFRSSEKYFDHKIFVFGHKYSSVKESLWPGSHSFPFQYTLPTKLPTSFHGNYGYVRYFCEASLERAWQPSVRRRTHFSVSAAVDVNLDSKAESSAGGQKTSNQCFFCCRAGTVVVEATIRRRGYVPGEIILVSADIANMSNHAVSSTAAKLIQVVTYHSSKGFRHRVDEVLVSDARQGRVPCGQSSSWEDVAVSIPALPATYHVTECCKVLDVDYRLDFIVEMEGGLEPLLISMPLVIGTVPLQRAFKCLQKPDPLLTGSPLARMTNLKYKGFPAVFSKPCIWGPRPLEHYFHRQIPRRPEEEAVRVWIPGETFAPRYVCYRNQDAEPTKPGGLEEPLTTEPPPPRRSRASSLQPMAASRPHSGNRIVQSSSHLAMQPQPLHDPIHRTLAQLKAYRGSVIPTQSMQSTPTRLLSTPRLQDHSKYTGDEPLISPSKLLTPKRRSASSLKSPPPTLKEDVTVEYELSLLQGTSKDIPTSVSSLSRALIDTAEMSEPLPRDSTVMSSQL